MTDFYTQFKPEIEKAVSVFAKQFSDCKKKLAKTESRLIDEKALLVRLQEQKEKLTGLADDTLAGNDNDYEKFKVSLKKVNAQIEATSEAVQVLESKIVPLQQKEVTDAGQKLASELNTFCLNHKGACEVEMSKLLNEIVKLEDSFLGAFDRFFNDYGLQFVIHDWALIPKPTHKRLEALAIVGRSPEQREAAMKAPTQAVASEVSHNEPVLTQTPAEGSLIPSEAVTQATDAHSPLNEPLETTPGTTLLTGIV